MITITLNYNKTFSHLTCVVFMIIMISIIHLPEQDLSVSMQHDSGKGKTRVTQERSERARTEEGLYGKRDETAGEKKVTFFHRFKPFPPPLPPPPPPAPLLIFPPIPPPPPNGFRLNPPWPPLPADDLLFSMFSVFPFS